MPQSSALCLLNRRLTLKQKQFVVVLVLFFTFFVITTNFSHLPPSTRLMHLNIPTDDADQQQLPRLLKSLKRIRVKRDAPPSLNTYLNCSNSLPPPILAKNKPLQWQPVSSASTAEAYVFSAYYDRRWNPPMVTIVGLASEYTAPQDGHRQRMCRMWFRGENEPRTVAANFRFENDWFKNTFTGVLYLCPAESPPYAVSLVSNCSESTDNLLEVVDAGLPADDNIIADGEEAPTTADSRQYTVCISALHSNYADFRRLVETIEFSRYFGAQRFVIYHSSSSPDIQLILDSYQRDGIVETVPWHSLPTNQVHYWGQVAALNDCLYRNLFRSTFVLFADVDEIAVPRYNTSGSGIVNWNGVLERATLEWSAGIEPVEGRFPGVFLIRNVFFRPNYQNKMDDSYNMTEWLRKDNVSSGDYVFRVYNLRENYVHKYDTRTKYFVLTRAVLMAGVHYPMEMFTPAAQTANVHENLCLLHHYRDRSQEPRQRRIIRDEVIDRFSRDVTQQISDRRKAIVGDLSRKRRQNH